MSGPRVRAMETRCRGRYVLDLFSFQPWKHASSTRFILSGASLGFRHLLHSVHWAGNEVFHGVSGDELLLKCTRQIGRTKSSWARQGGGWKFRECCFLLCFSFSSNPKSFLYGKSLDLFSTFCSLLLPTCLILSHHSPIPLPFLAQLHQALMFHTLIELYQLVMSSVLLWAPDLLSS